MRITYRDILPTRSPLLRSHFTPAGLVGGVDTGDCGLRVSRLRIPGKSRVPVFLHFGGAARLRVVHE